MCPPYELVDYGELYDLLDASPLLHAVRERSRAAGQRAASPAHSSPECNLSTHVCPPAPALCNPPHPYTRQQESIVIVEYPKKLAHLVRDRLGPLTKMRDRRYGRTYIAIYAGEAAEE